MALGRRVAFITNSLLLERPEGLFSPLASVRREILLPARALSERGVNTHVISLPSWPADSVREIIEKSHRVVFGKLLVNTGETSDTAYGSDAQAYRSFLQPGRSVFCFADDHFDAPLFAAFYREVTPASRAWIASSKALKEKLQGEAPCPVLSYPEVTETPRNAPRIPRHGIRERAGVWMARRSRVGLDPWRLKLLWFGHPTNVAPLLRVLPELEEFAGRVPVVLECVTQPGTQLDRSVTASTAAPSVPLRIISSPWSLDYMPFAFEECDVVILPQFTDDPKKNAKSNNRLVDALHAGRFTVAHPIPSYEELGDYCWVGESIVEGLDWLLRHPKEALRRVIAGQQHVAKYHSPDALADFWSRALELEGLPQSTH